MTRIYLAGAESGPLSDELEENNVKHILYSYFWLSKKDRERVMVERIKRGRENGIKYLLDSGAFTYLDAQQAGSRLPFNVYKKRYFDFIAKHGELFEACAELDVEGAEIDGMGTISLDQVWHWRQQMFEANPKATIMPVWHFGTRTQEEWNTLCEDPLVTYLGIGSTHSGAVFNQEGVFHRLIAKAHAHGKRVHGMAATKVKTQLKKLKFDSVDSASWLSAQKFGTTFIFKNGQWIVLDKYKKNQRRIHRRHFTKIGVDYQKLEADKSSELRHAAILAWRDLGEWLMKKRAKMHQDLEDQIAATPQVDPEVPQEKKVPATKKAKKSKNKVPIKVPAKVLSGVPAPQKPPRGKAKSSGEVFKIPCPSFGQKADDGAVKRGRRGRKRTFARTPITTSSRDGKQTPKVNDKATSMDKGDPTEKAPDKGTPYLEEVPQPTLPQEPVSQDALATVEQPDSTLPTWKRPDYLHKTEKQRSLLHDLPQLKCGLCSIGTDCPSYDESLQQCAFAERLNAFPVRDADNLLGAMEYIVDVNKSRLWKLLLMENMIEGGMPSERATQLSEIVLNQLERLREQRTMMEGAAVKVNSGPGILSSIFGVSGRGSVGGTAVQVNIQNAPARGADVRDDNPANSGIVVEAQTVPHNVPTEEGTPTAATDAQVVEAETENEVPSSGESGSKADTGTTGEDAPSGKGVGG